MKNLEKSNSDDSGYNGGGDSAIGGGDENKEDMLRETLQPA